MQVLKITPRGYCHGVVDAFRIAKRVREETQGPVHMLGMLVHNTHATDDLQRQGIELVDQPNRLAGLEHIKEGTVIFTAHGVSPQVKQRAVELGLTPVDATCSDVVRTHELVADLARKGYEVVYIGRKGHPEPEGVVGEAPGKVYLVQDPEDIDALDLEGDRVAVTCQTTLSVWDTDDLIARVLARYPQAEVHNEICRATPPNPLRPAGCAGVAGAESTDGAGAVSGTCAARGSCSSGFSRSRAPEPEGRRLRRLREGPAARSGLAVAAGGAATGGGSGTAPLARGRRRRRRGPLEAAGCSAAGRGRSAATPRFTLAPISPSAQRAPSRVCTSTRQTTIDDGAPLAGGRFWVSVHRA